MRASLFTRLRTVGLLVALTSIVLGSLAAPAEACHRKRKACRQPVAACPSQASWSYEAVSVESVSYSGLAEPSGFLAWLNSLRARHGLNAVAYDPQLASDAAVNSSRGFGHSYMGSARRQNVGVGPMPTVQSMWLASPAHASALLDPSIRYAAVAQAGSVITYSAR